MLGTIGAIDPYQHKILQLGLIESENERNRQKEQRSEVALKIREKDSFFTEMLRYLYFRFYLIKKIKKNKKKKYNNIIILI